MLCKTMVAGAMAIALVAAPSAAQAAVSGSVPTTAPSGSFADAVINPASTVAYITNASANEVDVLNLSDGTWGTPIPAGSDPQGIDITPNGQDLYVCDSGAQTILEISVATGAVVDTIFTPSGFDSERPYSIALTDTGQAIFSTTFAGSGFGAHVYDLDLSSGAISVLSGAGINGLVTEITRLARSADYSTVAGTLGDDSGGPFFVYSAATGDVVNGDLNDFIGFPTLNGNGSTLLVGGGDDQFVIDPSNGALLGTIATGEDGGAALSSSGSIGLVAGVHELGVLNIKTFEQVTTKPAQAVDNGLLFIAPNNEVGLELASTSAVILRK